MAKRSVPVRIDDDLYRSAAGMAEVMHRSTAQQISHWARVGQALEASPHVSVGRIVAALEGRTAYDDLGDEDQAVVRALWREKAETLRRSLRLDRQLAQRGVAAVELGDDGSIVRHGAPRPGSSDG